MTNIFTERGIGTNNTYRQLITRQDAPEWELSIWSDAHHSYGGHSGLFEVGLCHTHTQYFGGRQVEIVGEWATFTEVGELIEWFRNSTISQIQERFTSLDQSQMV